MMTKLEQHRKNRRWKIGIAVGLGLVGTSLTLMQQGVPVPYMFKAAVGYIGATVFSLSVVAEYLQPLIMKEEWLAEQKKKDANTPY